MSFAYPSLSRCSDGQAQCQEVARERDELRSRAPSQTREVLQLKESKTDLERRLLGLCLHH